MMSVQFCGIVSVYEVARVSALVSPSTWLSVSVSVPMSVFVPACLVRMRVVNAYMLARSLARMCAVTNARSDMCTRVHAVIVY